MAREPCILPEVVAQFLVRNLLFNVSLLLRQNSNPAYVVLRRMWYAICLMRG